MAESVAAAADGLVVLFLMARKTQRHQVNAAIRPIPRQMNDVMHMQFDVARAADCAAQLVADPYGTCLFVP